MNELRASWTADPPAWPEHNDGEAVTICLTGELDLATADRLRWQVMRVVCGAAATLVLDFSDVVLIDAHTVGVIVDARNAAESRGRLLIVEGLRGLPARVFALLGLESWLSRDNGAAVDPDAGATDGGKGTV